MTPIQAKLRIVSIIKEVKTGTTENEAKRIADKIIEEIGYENIYNGIKTK